MPQLTERPLTALQLSKKLNITEPRVWALTRAGKIPYINSLGERTKRFLLSDVWKAIYGDGPTTAIKTKKEEE
jgi:hypothetical protein